MVGTSMVNDSKNDVELQVAIMTRACGNKSTIVDGP